jgi:hypothetical protein
MAAQSLVSRGPEIPGLELLDHLEVIRGSHTYILSKIDWTAPDSAADLYQITRHRDPPATAG